MKLVIIVCVAVFGRVTSELRTHSDEEYWAAWLDFLAMDGVAKRIDGSYSSKHEFDRRFEIFKDNMEMIKLHNAKNLSWRMGLNQFADMTPSEFKDYTSCAMPNKPASRGLSSPKFEISVPDAVDWVDEGVVTPVKDQGMCGSCWSFSTTGAIESRSAISCGDLVSLSEQDLIDCSTENYGCRGGSMDYAFKFVIDNGGLCSEDEYPYIAKSGTCSTNCTNYDPITKYVDVVANTNALEAAIATGPVSIAIEADQSTFQFYRSGVLNTTCGTDLDHGVLVVGYGAKDGQDYWRVKNSWGEHWGDEGYIYLCRNCNANFGKGQCGILMSASYPVPQCANVVL